MDIKIEKDQWVWVIVQDPGGNEQFLGQHDQDTDMSFIPIFLEKDEAIKGLSLLNRDKKLKYEAQAILFEEITAHASDHGFKLIVLDGNGNVLKK
ncbi:hypothetical protein ACFL2O_00855 [Thermodesulfobacteriota bacterium]